MSHNSSNKRIAINTMFLYIRSIVIMAVSIFTSRIVLQALGVTDYGINNIVAGFVGMFSMISSSMVNASQRFISFEMGKKTPQLQKVFCVTFTIHVLLVLLMILIFESFGLWFLNKFINIDADRIVAANWIFQFSIVTFCIGILSTPFNATIISHEKMSAFAYISVFEVFAKLGIAYMLNIYQNDKLILYSLLLMVISIILFGIYAIYCRLNFKECKYQFMYDKSLFLSLMSFSGWNFLGSAAGVLVTQGVNVLTNIFFGVALNAARGIVEQINIALNQFVNNFATALNPQITQSHASGDNNRMIMLMMRGSKYAGLLYWFMGCIIFLQPYYILDLWLVNVPPYAPVFLRLAIIYSIFQALSNPLYIGMLATGKIKVYQIIMSLLYLSSFLLCYLLFYLGFGPEFGYISTIVAIVIAVYVRLLLLQKMIPSFYLKEYFESVIVPLLPVFIIPIVFINCVVYFIELSPFLKFLIVCTISILLIPLLMYIFSLDKTEKKIIKNKILIKINWKKI